MKINFQAQIIIYYINFTQQCIPQVTIRVNAFPISFDHVFYWRMCVFFAKKFNLLDWVRSARLKISDGGNWIFVYLFTRTMDGLGLGCRKGSPAYSLKTFAKSFFFLCCHVLAGASVRNVPFTEVIDTELSDILIQNLASPIKSIRLM